MTVYGLTRTSNVDHAPSPEVQQAEILKGAEQFGLGDVYVLHEDLGTSGVSTRFRDRKQGRWLMVHLQAGDVLIVYKLDRLGRDMGDILSTVDFFTRRDVRLICLQFGGRALDMSSTIDKVLVGVFAILAAVEVDLIRERTMAGKAYKRANGTYIQRPSYGRKKVRDANGVRGEWDFEQLAYIAEIAERLGNGERVELVAADFWDRKIKDHRGLPWGQVVPKNGLTPRGSPYRHFRQATRWFHRMKHAGELPPPYGELASLIPEPAGFQVEKRKKKSRKPGPNPPATCSADDLHKELELEADLLR